MKTKELLKKYRQLLPADYSRKYGDINDLTNYITKDDNHKLDFLDSLFGFTGSPKGNIPDYRRNGVQLVRDERTAIEAAAPKKVLALMLYPLISGMGSERFYVAGDNILRDVSRYEFRPLSGIESMADFLEQFARQDVVAEMLDIGMINLDNFFVLDGADLRIFDFSRAFSGYPEQSEQYKALKSQVNPAVQAEEKDLVRRRIVRSQAKIFEILEALKGEEGLDCKGDFPHFYKLFYGL